MLQKGYSLSLTVSPQIAAVYLGRGGGGGLSS